MYLGALHGLRPAESVPSSKEKVVGLATLRTCYQSKPFNFDEMQGKVF